MKKLRIMLLLLLCTVLVAGGIPINGYKQVSAATKDENPIVVSMGDSYASDEGIEPFYGQDKSAKKKVKDQDWLAHRSQLAWSGQLSLKGLSGTLSEHKDVNWFFVAASGAKTEDLYSSQEKGYIYSDLTGTAKLTPQLDVFDKLEKGSVDYVTISIGGNDIGFVDIVMVTLSSNIESFDEYMSDVWAKFNKEDGIRSNIKKAYKNIADKAGSQAMIIVAGYPKLFNPDGFSVPLLGIEVSPEIIQRLNSEVAKFNEAISGIVDECHKEGMNIVFVDVQKEFEGHEAYTNEPYINEIIFGSKEQDINQSGLVSSYSMHPNAEGAKVYANAIQKVIDEAEGKDSVSSDNSKKTVRVLTQKELNKALKNSKVDTIILRTDTHDSFTISTKKAKKKTLIIDAPYADITNKSKFKSIEIQRVDKYTENISGNSIIKSGYGDFEIAKGVTVKKVTFKDTDNDYIIRKGASIKTVVIEKEGNTAVYDSKTGVYKLVTKIYEEDYPFDITYEIKLDKSGRTTEFKTLAGYYDSDNLDKYTYDKNGNVTRFEHIDVASGNIITAREYKYDSKNREISYSDTTSGNYTYKYDSKGNRIQQNFENEYYISESKLTYDSNGRITKVSTEYCYISEGQKSDQESHDTVYKYNKKGFLISSKDTYSNGSIYIYEYTYDKAGNMTYMKYTEESTETSDVFISEFKYEYDELGLETNVLAKYPYNGGWVNPSDYAG